MTAFASYWSAYANAGEATNDSKPEWSEGTRGQGIVRAALDGLSRMLTQNAAWIPSLVEHPPGLIGESCHHVHQGYRFVLRGLDDASKSPLSTVAEEIVEVSREAFCLCVLPSFSGALEVIHAAAL